MEGAAPTQRAVHAQFAAHQAHQALADGQPQARAAEAARGRGLGLREAAEDMGLVLRGDADAAVAHGHLTQHVVIGEFDRAQAQHHLADVGELDGVAAQVGEHLLQTHVVAQQAMRQGRVDVVEHLDVLGAHIGRQDHRQITQQAVEAERPRVERHLAGLGLREVEDVVEQPQQGARCALGLGGVVQLAPVKRRVLQQLQHAQDGVHRGANLVAHVGQKLALRARGGFSRFGGLDKGRDVDAVAHGVAIGHAAFDDAQCAAFGQRLDQARRVLPVDGHALIHPGIDTAHGLGELAAFGAGAHDVLEAVARQHFVGAQRIEVLVALVAQHQPIVRIKQCEGIVQRVDRAAQHLLRAAGFGLGLFARRDVGVGGGEAAAGHGRAAHLQRDAGGPCALKMMRRRCARALDNRQNDGVHIAGAVLAALGTAADDLLEACLPAGKQAVGQIKQAAEFAVVRHQPQVGIKHAQAARQVLDHPRQEVVGALQLRRLALPLADVGADRDVLFNPAVGVDKGRNHAVDPVQVTAFASVADVAAPGRAAGDGAPHPGKEGRRLHPRVDDAVVLPQQLVAGIATDGAEGIVDFDDRAVAIGDRDDGVTVQGAQQRFGLALRSQQLKVGAFFLRDVGGHLHEADQHTFVVARGLNFGVDPAIAPVLGAVEHFDATGCTGRRGVEQGLDRGRIGFGVAEQLARCAAHGVGQRMAGEARKAFVDPGDFQCRVGDEDGVGGVPHHARHAVEIRRHALRPVLRAHPAHGQQPHGQRQQAAGQRAADGDGGEAGSVDRGFEGRCCVHPQGQRAATHVELARGFELASFGLGGGQGARRGGGMRVEDQRAGLRRVVVEDLKVEHVVGGLGHTRQKLGGHDGREDQANQCVQPLLRRAWIGAAPEQGHEVQKPRALLAVLHQGDLAGERVLAGADGPHHGLAAHGFLANIEAP